MSKAEERAAKKALETFPILFGERNGMIKRELIDSYQEATEAAI